MADGVENIVYAVKAEGTERTASAFKEVSGGLERNQLIANNLSQALKALGREQQAQSRVVQRAYDETAKAAKRAAAAEAAASRESARAAREKFQAFQQSAREATRSANANAQHAAGMKVFTDRAKGGAIAIGQFANTAAAAIPGLNGVGAAIARASGTIGGLTQLIGVGRGSILAGTFLAAFGATTEVMNAFAESQDRATDKADKFTRTLEEQIETLQRLDRAANLASAVGQGLGGPEAQLAEVRRLEAQRDFLQGRYRSREVDVRDPGRFTFGVNITPRSANDRQLQSLQAQLRANAVALQKARALHKQALQEEAEIATEDAEFEEALKRQQEREKKQREKKPAEIIAYANYGDPITESERASSALGLMQADAASASRRLRLVQGFAAERAAGDKALQEAGKGAGFGAANLEAQRVLAGEDANEKARTDRLTREWAKRDKLVTDHHDLLRNSAHEAWTMVGASAGAALAALAAGQKVALAEVLGALGQQLVASGTGHVFEGIFQSLLLNPLGPEMVAIGTAEAAFGASLAAAGGGASRAASAGTGSGGASPTYSQTNTVDRSGERFELHIHSGEPPSQEYIVRTYRGLQQAARNGLIPRLAEAS